MLAVWCELRKESFSLSPLLLRLVLPIQSFTPAIIHASPDLDTLHLPRKYCELPPTAYFPAVECGIHGTDWRPIWMPGEQGSCAFLGFKIPIYGFRRIWSLGRFCS